MVFVAEEDNEIVGVLRGCKERLQSLFVRADHHRRGIGQKLVDHFEAECIRQGSGKVVLAATLYAIPFYTAMGYIKSTGVRNGWSFEGTGLKYKPMKKVFTDKVSARAAEIFGKRTFHSGRWQQPSHPSGRTPLGYRCDPWDVAEITKRR